MEVTNPYLKEDRFVGELGKKKKALWALEMMKYAVVPKVLNL